MRDDAKIKKALWLEIIKEGSKLMALNNFKSIKIVAVTKQRK